MNEHSVSFTVLSKDRRKNTGKGLGVLAFHPGCGNLAKSSSSCGIRLLPENIMIGQGDFKH